MNPDQSWKTGAPKDRQTAIEAEKRMIMRRAKTNSTTTHGMGGLPKTKGHLPKKITLPTVNLDDE